MIVTVVLAILLTIAITLSIYLAVLLVRSERASRTRRDTVREELSRSLDAFEDALAAELATHTVPQRMMEHLRSTLANQSEQFAAFDTRFAYDPKDTRFLGSPIDFVVFSGRASGTVDEVVFIEVKQHERVALSKPERSLKDAIEKGNVRWERFDLAATSGVDRERVRMLGAEALEADVSRAVREKTRGAKEDLVERITKHL